MENSIRISSSLQNIHIVEEYIDCVRNKFQIDDSLYGNIHLAVVEAVTNAIIHGNKMDASKSVVFNSKLEQNTISFHVKDQGNGFDATVLPDPTSPENKFKLCGRGVFLIRHLADRVEFQENGTSIEMTFQLA